MKRQVNPLLEELDVTNISSLDQVLNLHKLTNLYN